ncbi:MAG: Gfo/Idh/MocA family oxidoreductase [Victivallaceae bacterium]|jgi:predicted dehydrogenase|nr:Gfo/Idh/MocA family oxidoreductase [Victivallaceae bacterium]MDD3115834.1 Gfo/Idh/MocA family oxidoreductase [Victivallaceae bacterium]MDD3702731.1 Gfo/Idh/MocA family oxidoreductase [Victivallaceae bacterium]MDD4318647.1 Gfo/Idh/MocA family oxidoreductase [Victivallaceae bacterium]MDD5662759.1 Gfo/Idh/MocA family oxidoreductase [Victivallaceae bacterium]
MKHVTCAVIGCGVIAPTHIESFIKIPDLSIKHLCDLDLNKAEKLAAQYSIPNCTTDYRAILMDPEVDCVSVCTDHFSHAEITVAALEHGKHVICEKALTSTESGIDAMLDAHRKRPELVFSGIFQHRCEPTNRYLRNLIQSGKFGRILTCSLYVSCLRTNEYYQNDAWRGTWANEGGGVLINQSIHHLDLLRYFFGDIESVAASYDNFVHQGVIETEDTIAIALRFRSGILGTVIATSGSKSVTWRSGYTITGTEGFMEYTDFIPSYVDFVDSSLKEKVIKDFSDCKLDDALQVSKGYYGGGHPAQIADIIDAIRNGREPYVSGEAAAGTAKLVLACYESSRTGKWVNL